ncbi:MAG: signal peptide peptidase SppA [Armatimonadetes bacterium]|nr:signal peptide peptidase SppA [Armatimonadota bacterium]
MSVEDPDTPSSETGQAVGQPPPPPREAPRFRTPRRWAGWWIPAGIGCGCLFWLAIGLAIVGGLVAIVSSPEAPGPKVALIHVDGVITAGTSGGIFGGGAAGSETIVSRLERARKDDQVKAVVLRINSPGGSAAGSEEVYREIKRVREKKPVYTSMGDVAASGGYYIASACDRVMADGSTITGSIGVIMESSNLSGLLDKLGIEIEVVKSGKFKDMGGPHRSLTPQERQLIQDMIDDTFEQFIEAVSQGRKMPKENVRELATGQVFTGRQAKNLGLVDEIGGLREAVIAAGRAGGIAGEPRVVDYDRRGGLYSLLGEVSSMRRLTASDYDLIADRIIRQLTVPGNQLEGLR